MKRLLITITVLPLLLAGSSAWAQTEKGQSQEQEGRQEGTDKNPFPWYTPDEGEEGRDRSQVDITLAPAEVKVVQAAPSAAQATRYADYPVSYGLGLADISIPLYTIQSRTLSLPISLSYNSGGIRVDDVSGPEGLGWTLEAGGVITLTVNGLNDKDVGGWSYRDNNDDPASPNYQNLAYLKAVAKGENDSAADIYAYNFCGHRGSFYIDWTTTPSKIVTTTATDLDIIYTGPGFVIKDTDGTTYKFEQRDTTSRQLSYTLPYFGAGGSTISGSIDPVTAWYLTEISTMDDTDVIEFSYEKTGILLTSHRTEMRTYQFTYKYEYGGTYLWRGANGLWDAAGPAVSTMNGAYIVENIYTPCYLKTITYAGGTVTFSYKNSPFSSSPGTARRSYPKLLSAMRVNPSATVSADTSATRRCVFNYTNTGDTRSLLSTVSITGRGDTPVESYTLGYISGTTNMDWCAKDLFGYYNAASNTGTSFLRLFEDNGTFIESVANRNYNATAVSALSLETISTASGAKTRFVYEGNGLSTSGTGAIFSTIGIGHRIKRIITSDLSGGQESTVRVREFSYGSPGITIPLQAFRRQAFISVGEQFRADLVDGIPYWCQTVQYSGIPRTATVGFCDQSAMGGVPLESARIYYGIVTERVSDSVGGSSSVRTDYLFDSSGAVHAITGGVVPSGSDMDTHDNDNTNNLPGGNLVHFFRRPPSQIPRSGSQTPSVDISPVWSHYVPEDFPQITSPVTVKRYKTVGSTETLISQTDNEYDNTSATLLTALDIRNLIDAGDASYMANINHVADYYRSSIYQKLHWYRLAKTTETEWLDNPVAGQPALPRYAVTTYTYIPTVNVPTPGSVLTPKTRTLTVTDADSPRTYIWTYTYPSEIGGGLPWMVGLNSRGYKKPFIEQVTVGGGSNAPLLLRTTTWAFFTPADTGSGTLLRPSLVTLSRRNPGETSTQNVGPNVHYNAYDSKGNPLEVAVDGQPTTTYVWAYGNLKPILEVIGDNYANVNSATASAGISLSTLAAGLPTESQLAAVRTCLESGNTSRMVSWYHYDSPFGMTAASDVSSRLTRYAYDGAGRLVAVKDKDGNLVTSYTYALVNGGSGTPNSISSTTHKTASTSLTTGVKNVVWFDGLGRTVQTVSVGAATSAKDLITPVVPDFLDREDTREYIPYPASSGSAGSYRSGAIAAQQSYYGSGVKGYTENTYELSARNLVTASSLPGFTETSTAAIKASAGSTVLKLSYNSANNTLSANGYYSQNRFTVTITTAPDGSRKESYADEFGTPVLERVKLNASGTMADTYYVKDVLGRVLCVVPPDQSAQLSSSTAGFSAVNCYTYKYDGRDLVIERQLPGQARDTLTYNGANLLLTRTRLAADGLANEVFSTSYDSFNRPTSETYRYGSNATVTLAEYQYDSYPSWATGFSAESGYVAATDISSLTRGLKTAERLTLLPAGVAPSGLNAGNTSTKATRAYYYDVRGNVRQVAGTNAQGGVTRISSSYNFAGKLLKERQRISPGSGQTAHTLNRTYTYDARLRLASVSAKLDNGSTATQAFTYDNLQRTATVNRGGGMETTQYDYTLQGWLSSASSATWEETLRYQAPVKSGTDALPGKVGLVTEWVMHQMGTSSGGMANGDTYTFSYDKAGRLTGSLRYANGSSSSTYALTERSITYDRSGNLLTLSRYGTSGSTPSESLSFSYTGPKRSGWTYDSHGNVTADPKAGVSIAYNVLDMPRTLQSGSAGTERSYLSDGTLARVGDGTTTRLYLGDMVFLQTSSGTSLESAGWEGGRLLSGTGTDKVLYYVTDHLGSTRVVKDGGGNVRQRFDYYPYGSVSKSWTSSGTTDYSEKRFRFGGKEIAGTSLTDLTGIGPAPGAPYLDFGARFYSPGSAAWLTQDPLAEKYYPLTPYGYCAGSPVNLVDPDGRRHRLKYYLNTITVEAFYYVTDDQSLLSAKQGIRFWNNRQNDTYTDKETGKTYRIRYKLDVVLKDKIYTKDYDGDDPVNVYMISDEEMKKQKPGSVGVTLNTKRNLIYIKSDYAFINPSGEESSTPAHEIGHTLGMHHYPTGIMTESQDDSRSEDVPQVNIDQMINSADSMRLSLFTLLYEAFKGLF